jgi:hypothetical protein
VAGSCEHGNEPLGSIKGVEFLIRWVTISFWRRTLPYGVSYMWPAVRISGWEKNYVTRFISSCSTLPIAWRLFYVRLHDVSGIVLLPSSSDWRHYIDNWRPLESLEDVSRAICWKFAYIKSTWDNGESIHWCNESTGTTNFYGDVRRIYKRHTDIMVTSQAYLFP